MLNTGTFPFISKEFSDINGMKSLFNPLFGQGNNLLVAEIEKAGGVDFSRPVLLGYTGLSDVLLQKYIEDSKALWEQGTQELHSTIIGSVIGTHAGPGAVAAAFFRKQS